MPTERRRPRRACADRAVDTRARRVVCAVCRVTSPRLLLSASHRRFGSVRADTGDAERAPSRERVVVPTERRRPRRACADRAVDTRARRVVCAVVCRVTSPRLLLSSSHRRLGSVRADTGDAERAPSRERVVVPTERRRPRRACADRAVDTRARRVVCAVCRVTSPRLLRSRRIAGSALSEPTPATPSERRAASESSCRPSAADLVVRAPIVPSTHARAAVCAAVRRVTSPRLLLSSSHRRLGSVRADAGDAERAPSRERVVVPTERRRPRRACADRAVDARARRRVRRRASSDITALSFCCSLRHRPSSVIVREPTLATPSERRAASELALSRCRASRLLHLSPWRLTNNAGSRAVSRQGSTIHVFDIVAGIGRRSAVLRRRGPWPRRGDSRVRSPSRRSAPLASSSSRSRFSLDLAATKRRANAQSMRTAPTTQTDDRRS